MNEDGMTRSEAVVLMNSLEQVGRYAIFVYRNADGGYRAEWDGKQVNGKNPFQLDSRLDQIGAPTRRNLFLIREEA